MQLFFFSTRFCEYSGLTETPWIAWVACREQKNLIVLESEDSKTFDA